MSTTRNLAMIALAGLMAGPLPAQVILGDATRDRIEANRRRAEEARTRATMESVLGRNERSSSRVPPGHLPPRGMCRVWIDGVPPGQQPPVTDCTTAERHRTANSRVIYGDRESFPGKGKGKFKNRDATGRSCTLRDAVVVGGRVIDVCRDGTVQADRRGRGRLESDDDDRFEDDDDDRGRGDQMSKAQRKAGKAARKGNRGKG